MIVYSTTRRDETFCITSDHLTGFFIDYTVKWKEERLAFLFPSIFDPQTIQNNNNTNATPNSPPTQHEQWALAVIATIIKVLKQDKAPSDSPTSQPLFQQQVTKTLRNLMTDHWTSLTFLEYIHNQITHLSKDLSKKMGTSVKFPNIVSMK